MPNTAETAVSVITLLARGLYAVQRLRDRLRDGMALALRQRHLEEKRV
jgi:hypothetical protein